MNEHVLTKEQVKRQLDPLMGTRLRSVETTPRTRIVYDPEAVILQPGSGGKMVPFSEEGLTSLGKFLKIPNGLRNRLTDATASTVASELLRKTGEYDYYVKNDHVVAIFSHKRRFPIEVERLLSMVDRAIPEAQYVRVFLELDKQLARVEVMGNRRVAVAGSALVNDIVAGGAIIAFSPLGTIAPAVQSYVLRTWCTNGCSTPVYFDAFSYGGGGGEGDDMWQWFRQAARKAYQGVTKIAGTFEKMAGENISPDDRAAILETMIKEAGFNEEVARGVRAEALRNPPRDSWDMMNLITYGSSHLLTDGRQVARAHRSLNEFMQAESNDRTCPMCHQRRGRVFNHGHDNEGGEVTAE